VVDRISMNSGAMKLDQKTREKERPRGKEACGSQLKKKKRKKEKKNVANKGGR